MYEAYFGLICRPFPSVPLATFYYPGSAIEYARQTLARCIERGEGVGIAVGPIGCGKSLLGQMLAEHFANRMRVVQLPSGRLKSRRALLQAILHGLRCPFRRMDEGELRLALLDCLSRDAEKRRPMLLLVDEAHSLPLGLLDELRMTTNLCVDGQPCTRLVLVGGPVLEEKLTSPKLESFSQRIVVRCYLESFGRTETCECIRAQIAAASTTPKILFSDDACEAVHQATDGVPRLINQLCDHALILAYADGKESVDRATVEEAWADLQQLPTPSGAGPCEENRETIIEFGGLDEGEGSITSDAENEVDALEDPQAAGGVPPLHLAADEEDVTVRFGQRLDTVDHALADLDDLGGHFEPAGRITPEADLVLHDPAELLNEDFQDEEVVVDRYGRPEAVAGGEDTPRLRRPPDEPRGEQPAGPPQSQDEPIGEVSQTGEATLEVLDRCIDRQLSVAFENVPRKPVAEPAAPSGQEPCRAAAEDGAKPACRCHGRGAAIAIDAGSADLEMHVGRELPAVGSKDFARLFSNLRRTAT